MRLNIWLNAYKIRLEIYTVSLNMNKMRLDIYKMRLNANRLKPKIYKILQKKKLEQTEFI